jgi:hypothetical protein
MTSFSKLQSEGLATTLSIDLQFEASGERFDAWQRQIKAMGV